MRVSAPAASISFALSEILVGSQDSSPTSQCMAGKMWLLFFSRYT